MVSDWSASIPMMYGYVIPMIHQKFHARSQKVSCEQYLPQLYERYPLPIKAAKAADLKKLASQYVPASARDMYIDLPTVEDLDEYDGDSA